MKKLLDDDVPDESQKEFLQKKFPNLVFLESDWERIHIRIWINSRLPVMGGVYIDPQTVFTYCKEYGLNKIETLETVREMQSEAASVKKS